MKAATNALLVSMASAETSRESLISMGLKRQEPRLGPCRFDHMA